MHLCAAGEVGGEERGASAAAEVTGEVGEAGDLVGFAGGDTDVVERADGDEDEGEADDLEHAPEGDGAEGGVEVETREVVDADGGDEVAEADHEAGIDFAKAAAGDEHHEHHDEACGREHHAGAFGGVAKKALEVLRDEHGRAEEHHAEDELEEDGGAEVTIFEELQVDDGVGMVPLPPGEDDECDGGEDGEGADHGVAEPVLFLALVEGEFETANAQGYEAQAHEVDLEVLCLLHAQLEVGWVFDDAVAEVERDEADGDVDEEDPVPVEVVGDPAAEGGADGGSDDDGHAVDGEGLATLFDGESVGQDGLLAGGEAAAACALQDARDDEKRKRICNAAEERTDGEERDAGHVEALAAEAVGEPAGDGQDDGAGDEIAGEDPGGFFGAGAERAGDVGQGDVGDGGVEDLHEGGEGDGERDRPWIMVGLPHCGYCRGHGRGCHISLLI